MSRFGRCIKTWHWPSTFRPGSRGRCADCSVLGQAVGVLDEIIDQVEVLLAAASALDAFGEDDVRSA